MQNLMDAKIDLSTIDYQTVINLLTESIYHQQAKRLQREEYWLLWKRFPHSLRLAMRCARYLTINGVQPTELPNPSWRVLDEAMQDASKNDIFEIQLTARCHTLFSEEPNQAGKDCFADHFNHQKLGMTSEMVTDNIAFVMSLSYSLKIMTEQAFAYWFADSMNEPQKTLVRFRFALKQYQDKVLQGRYFGKPQETQASDERDVFAKAKRALNAVFTFPQYARQIHLLFNHERRLLKLVFDHDLSGFLIYMRQVAQRDLYGYWCENDECLPTYARVIIANEMIKKNRVQILIENEPRRGHSKQFAILKSELLTIMQAQSTHTHFQRIQAIQDCLRQVLAHEILFQHCHFNAGEINTLVTYIRDDDQKPQWDKILVQTPHLFTALTQLDEFKPLIPAYFPQVQAKLNPASTIDKHTSSEKSDAHNAQRKSSTSVLKLNHGGQ